MDTTFKATSIRPPSALSRPAAVGIDSAQHAPHQPGSADGMLSDLPHAGVEPARYLLSDRVLVRGKDTGVVQYVGETKFAAGEWYGVALDTAQGKNDGSVNGVRYFQCESNHGVFVKSNALSKRSDLEVIPGKITAGTQSPATNGDSVTSGGSDVLSSKGTSGIETDLASSMSPSLSLTDSTQGSAAGNPNVPHENFASYRGLHLGDRVFASQGRWGTIRYMGKTGFKEGVWCGIELDAPSGLNDGTVHNVRYFQCDDKKGIFKLADRVLIEQREHAERELSSTTASGINTPRSIIPAADIAGDRRGSGGAGYGLHREGSQESIASRGSLASFRSYRSGARLGLSGLGTSNAAAHRMQRILSGGAGGGDSPSQISPLNRISSSRTTNTSSTAPINAITALKDELRQRDDVMLKLQKHRDFDRQEMLKAARQAEEYEESYMEMSREYEALKVAHDASEAQLHALQANYNALHAEHADTQYRFTDLKARFDELDYNFNEEKCLRDSGDHSETQQIEQLKKELAQKEQKLTLLTKQMQHEQDAARRVEYGLADSASDAADSLQQAHRQLQLVESRCIELEQSVAAKTQRIAEFELKCEKLENEGTHLADEQRAALELALAEKDMQLAGLSQKAEAAALALESNMWEHARIVAGNEQKLLELQELIEAERKRATDNQNILEKRLADAALNAGLSQKSLVAEQVHTIAELHAQLKKDKIELDKLQLQLTKTAEERDNLSTNNKSLSSEKSQLDQTLRDEAEKTKQAQNELVAVQQAQKSIMDDKNAQLASFEEQAKVTSVALKTLQEQMTREKLQNDTVSRELEKAREREHSLVQQLAGAESVGSETSGLVNELNDTVAELRQQILMQSKQHDELQQQLTKSNTERVELESSRTAAVKKTDKLETKLEASEQKYAAQGQELHAMHATVAGKEEQISVQEQTAKRLAVELNSAREELGRFVAESEQAKSRLQALLDATQAEAQDRQKQLEQNLINVQQSSASAVDQLKTTVQELRQQVSAERCDFESKVKFLTKERSENEDTIKNLRYKLDAVRQKTADYSSSIEKLEEQSTKLTSELIKSDQALMASQKHVEEINAQAARNESVQNFAFEQKISLLNKQQTELQRELERVESERRMLSKTLQETNTQLELARNEAQRLRTREQELLVEHDAKLHVVQSDVIIGLQSSLSNNQHQLATRNQAFAEVQQRLTTSVAENFALSNQLEIERGTLEQVQAQLDSAVRKLSAAESKLNEAKIKATKITPNNKSDADVVFNGAVSAAANNNTTMRSSTPTILSEDFQWDSKISFLNSVIAQLQEKNVKLEEKVKTTSPVPTIPPSEPNRTPSNSTERHAARSARRSKRSAKKQLPTRKFCDICDAFDQHDTEECPELASGRGSPPRELRAKPVDRVRLPLRKYCDSCEVFDQHDTPDCPTSTSSAAATPDVHDRLATSDGNLATVVKRQQQQQQTGATQELEDASFECY